MAFSIHTAHHYRSLNYHRGKKFRITIPICVMNLSENVIWSIVNFCSIQCTKCSWVQLNNDNNLCFELNCKMVVSGFEK